MKNEELSEALRSYVRENLTPTKNEKKMVSDVYAAICSVLGRNKCFQIGSFPRFTAIRPPHDLDVLYVIDRWPGQEPDATTLLSEVKKKIESELIPPAGLSFMVQLQTHSVTISFLKDQVEVFAADLVPAWTTGLRNEFNDDIYRVPEIILKSHPGRVKFYERLAETRAQMDYILSDPKGYISVAFKVNAANPDFRKSVKILKKWKSWAKENDQRFKLKSFHIEQIVTSFFRQETSLDILEATLKFFNELPHWISQSQIPDRADQSRNIDAYIDDLKEEEREVVIDARDLFLNRLNQIENSAEVEVLFEQRTLKAAAGAQRSQPTAPTVIVHDREVVTPRPPFGDK